MRLSGSTGCVRRLGSGGQFFLRLSAVVSRLVSRLQMSSHQPVAGQGVSVATRPPSFSGALCTSNCPQVAGQGVSVANDPCKHKVSHRVSQYPDQALSCSPMMTSALNTRIKKTFPPPLILSAPRRTWSRTTCSALIARESVLILKLIPYG